MDLRGCDVILDEIHTYSDVMQSIVLRIIEILVALDCRVHVGTATMPTVLYEKILELLGGNDAVYGFVKRHRCFDLPILFDKEGIPTVWPAGHIKPPSSGKQRDGGLLHA